MRNVSRVGRAAAVVTAAAAAAAVTMPGPATAAVNVQATHQIRTFAGKCLDVRGGSSGDGAWIIQYHCTGASNQKFSFNLPGGRIHTFAGKCLARENALIGAQIIQLTCTGSVKESFRFVGDGSYWIQGSTGLCLDVRDGNPQDGAQIVQRECDVNASTQRFTVG
jgi:hypothetical protein